MSGERGSNGMEANQLTPQFMKDWCWANGETLELWERKAIRKLDAKRRNAQ